MAVDAVHSGLRVCLGRKHAEQAAVDGAGTCEISKIRVKRSLLLRVKTAGCDCDDGAGDDHMGNQTDHKDDRSINLLSS